MATALLVIDLQAWVVDAPETYRREETLAVVGDLLARARAAGVAVLHARHTDETEVGAPPPGTAAWDLHPAVVAAAGEPIIDKRADDAFWDTDLAARLEALGVDRLVLAGALSEHCVGTTARAAVGRGYDVVVAADGHTTWDNAILDGATAVAYQNMLLDGFGTPEHEIAVVPGADIDLP